MNVLAAVLFTLSFVCITAGSWRIWQDHRMRKMIAYYDANPTSCPGDKPLWMPLPLVPVFVQITPDYESTQNHDGP